MNDTLTIPQELINESLCIGQTFPCIFSKDFVSSIPFIHEVHYYQHLETFKPWSKENLQESIKNVLQEWKQLKPQLELYIEQKNKVKLKTGVFTGVQYFLECLFWVNEQPVYLKDEMHVDNLVIKPFNLEDRLSFIIKRLDGYHSYRQLEELFKELEKQFFIKLIKMNR